MKRRAAAATLMRSDANTKDRRSEGEEKRKRKVEEETDVCVFLKWEIHCSRARSWPCRAVLLLQSSVHPPQEQDGMEL
jgi:hypothetical protein